MMAHQQYYSATVDARLIELSKAFLVSRDAFFRTADEFHWEPAADSMAERAARALPSPDPQVAVRPGESGHRMIVEVVQTYLLTASGHLGGLASLYASGEVLFPPPGLIRAIIENCAHAMWVLGEGPDEPTEQRLARAYLEELKSAEEAKKNAGYMRGEDHPSHQQAKEHYIALKREILARFPGTTKQQLGAMSLLDQVLPGPQAAVTWMYGAMERLGWVISQKQAEGIYGLLSNMTHPTLYPARQRRGWVHDTSSDHYVAYLRVDIKSREDEARVALATFYNTLTYVTDYFGWPNDVLDDLELQLEGVIPTFFGPQED